MGTTSACAENTHPATHNNALSRNYLRVRGEYALDYLHGLLRTELPPRARRIRLPRIILFSSTGTTSACAENTPGAASRSCAIWNYLRVRGEYPFVPPDSILVPELPPRARRILQRAGQVSVGGGTTSACAENTRSCHRIEDWCRNYLRVRGEYPQRKWPGRLPPELPPRARRIPLLNSP